MQKSIHSELARAFREHLVALRKQRGWTQRDLAAAASREPSFVARIELGERRVDVIEYWLLLRILGAKPSEAVQELFARFAEAAGATAGAGDEPKAKRGR